MKIQLKRSSVLDSGAAKAPTADQMEFGELAVNYNAGDPSIFLKDSTGNIIKSDLNFDSSVFVKVAGDNMTGNLTLGTDKITLDATNGKSYFSDNLQTSYGGPSVNVNGAEDVGVFAGAGGIITVTSSDAGRGVTLRGFQKGSTSQKWGIYSNGDIISTGFISSTTYLYMGPTGSDNPNITLDGTDGSASFADGAAIISPQGKVEVKRNDSGVAANNNAAIVVKDGVTSADAIKLYGTGSATFMGSNIIVGGAEIGSTSLSSFAISASNTSNINATGTIYARNYGPSGATCYQAADNAGNIAASIYSNGNATFAGNVTSSNITAISSALTAVHTAASDSSTDLAGIKAALVSALAAFAA